MLEGLHLQPQCRCLPLIIVEGFLGGTSSIVWGDFERYLNQGCHGCKREVIFSSVGPVSSLHDRACELYFSILGGIVDYGEEHSAAHGHSRYGRVYEQGLYPKWSREKPLHFLGHSTGGPTIVKLQYLLKQGHFGAHVHPDWIRSVNTLSSPFRGTQAVYILGECVDTSPCVRPFSLGAMIARAVHIISYLSPILPTSLDLHTDSRRMSLRDITIPSLLKQLWKSEWAESRDATPYDVTFKAADEREANGEGEPHPRTFYQSWATCITQESERAHSAPLTFSFMPLVFLFMARGMCSFDFSKLRPVPSFLSDGVTEMTANDGLVPLFSQCHPGACSSACCRHSETKEIPIPGVWYVKQLCNTTHLSVLPFWVASTKQKQYWSELGCWLRTIERQHVN